MREAADRGGGCAQDALGRPVVEDGAGRLRPSGAGRGAVGAAPVCSLSCILWSDSRRMRGTVSALIQPCTTAGDSS
jgi:hypothetical protein